MNACGSSGLSQLQPGTCMRFIQGRSPRWWVPYYLKRSSLSSRDFGISSDPHNLSRLAWDIGLVPQSVAGCRCRPGRALIGDRHQSIYGGSIMRAVLTLLLLLVGWSSVVEAATGMEACTRHTPVGIGCYCNRGIVSSHQFPGWNHASGPFFKPMYVRPGWHV